MRRGRFLLFLGGPLHKTASDGAWGSGFFTDCDWGVEEYLAHKVGEEGGGVTVDDAVAVGVLDVVKLESESDQSS